MARKLRVALISLYALENNGIRHVAASLREGGWGVTEVYFKDWVNNFFPWPEEREVQALIELLRRRRVDVIGFSVRASAFHRMAKYLTDRLRHALGLPILWGGMHPTFVPEKCIVHADYIAVGEVDRAVVEFFAALEGEGDHRAVRGFWVREGDVIHRNDVAPLVALDDLPFRDYHSADDKFHIEGSHVTPGDPFVHNPEYTILASRGCPYWTCTFCSNTLTRPLYDGRGANYRVRSVESLVREVEYARELCRDVKVIRFDDEVFPSQRDWLVELAEQWPRRVGVPFEILVDPRMVRLDSLRLLKQAGLRGLCMGIQHTERINQRFYNRPTTDQQIIDAQHVFKQVGLKANLQIIWDDPFSTEQDKDDLFHLLMKLERPFELFLFGLTLYPETHLARRLLREGWVTEDQVEGIGTHAFEQFRVDLSYPRPVAEQRWLALIVLLNKDFVPKALVWKLYAHQGFKRDPRPLIAMAQAANLAKMATVVAELTLSGEMSPLLIKRWFNPRSLITM